MIPPHALLALAFLYELLLVTTTFVVLLSLEERRAAGAPPNSKGYNDSAPPQRCFPFHDLCLPAVNFIKILHCEGV